MIREWTSKLRIYQQEYLQQQGLYPQTAIKNSVLVYWVAILDSVYWCHLQQAQLLVANHSYTDRHSLPWKMWYHGAACFYAGRRITNHNAINKNSTRSIQSTINTCIYTCTMCISYYIDCQLTIKCIDQYIINSVSVIYMYIYTYIWISVKMWKNTRKWDNTFLFGNSPLPTRGTAASANGRMAGRTCSWPKQRFSKQHGLSPTGCFKVFNGCSNMGK